MKSCLLYGIMLLLVFGCKDDEPVNDMPDPQPGTGILSGKVVMSRDVSMGNTYDIWLDNDWHGFSFFPG